MALWLSIAGCAQPQPQPQQPQMTETGLPIVRDGEHRVSRNRWEVVQLPGEATPLAAIVDSTGTVMLTLGCGTRTSLMMGPDKGPELKNPRIALAWDGQKSTESLFESFPATSGWGFGIEKGEANFEPAMSRLRQHQTLEVTISDAGIEPLRYRFSLMQADKALDHVLGVCCKKA